MLKNPFSPRLLKKVQMQGGAPGTHLEDGCRCEAYLVRTSQRRASTGVPTEGGSLQMGLFQQPASANSSRCLNCWPSFPPFLRLGICSLPPEGDGLHRGPITIIKSGKPQPVEMIGGRVDPPVGKRLEGSLII